MVEAFEITQFMAFRFGRVVPLEERERAANLAMTHRTNAFVERCLAGCIVLIDAGLEAQALILGRSPYEASIRILWATRTPNGWKRLQAYWAEEDIKWAKSASSVLPENDHPQGVLRARKELRERVDEQGHRFKPAPGVFDILQELEVLDRTSGLVSDGHGPAEFQYAYFYRMCSGLSHGHPGHIDQRPESGRHQVALLAAMAECCVVALRMANDSAMPRQAREDGASIDSMLARLSTSKEAAFSADRDPSFDEGS